MKEIWLPIKEYPGYEVSNLGRVKSYKGLKERLLKLSNNTNGYPIVSLFKGKKGHTKMVHRLVAVAFIPNPKNKKFVHHKDSKRDNPRADNLTWCTHKENIRQAFLDGRMNGPNTPNAPKGEKHSGAKLTKEKVLTIRRLYNSGVDKLDLAKTYNVAPCTIKQAAERITWKHVD